MSTGLDGKVKVWDVKESIEPIFEKEMKAEKLFCSSFYCDNPWLLACGSSVGELVIWDLAVKGTVSQHFSPRTANKPHQANEHLFQK